MTEHMAMVVAIAVRLPTIVEVVDGRNNRVVVACPTTFQGDEVDLVFMVIISVASRVTA